MCDGSRRHCKCNKILGDTTGNRGSLLAICVWYDSRIGSFHAPLRMMLDRINAKIHTFSCYIIFYVLLWLVALGNAECAHPRTPCLLRVWWWSDNWIGDVLWLTLGYWAILLCTKAYTITPASHKLSASSRCEHDKRSFSLKRKLKCRFENLMRYCHWLAMMKTFANIVHCVMCARMYEMKRIRNNWVQCVSVYSALGWHAKHFHFRHTLPIGMTNVEALFPHDNWTVDSPKA